jgi:hypothetical protein
MAGRTSLVNSVISLQAIYYLTPLVAPSGTLSYVNMLKRAFIWLAKDSSTDGKCMNNWETVRRPKNLGGLGVLHLDKFATALRLRCHWLSWEDDNKIRACSANPCSEEDMDIFYAATAITLGNGRMMPLNGRKPKDIEPIIYESSKRNKCIVSDALHDDAWIGKVSLEPHFLMNHPSQLWTYGRLWKMLILMKMLAMRSLESLRKWAILRRVGL